MTENQKRAVRLYEIIDILYNTVPRPDTHVLSFKARIGCEIFPLRIHIRKLYHTFQ